MGKKELDDKEKVKYLQQIIPYFCYKKLIDNNFSMENLVDLYEEIQESEGGENFQISKECKGKRGDFTETSLEVWINQTCNGGYSGDEFAGDVFVKINDNEYLTWIYWM